MEGALGGISQGKKPEMASVTGLPGRVGDRYSSPLSPTASDVTPSVICTGPSLELPLRGAVVLLGSRKSRVFRGIF